MSLIALLAKVYIIVLIMRWILTQQELVFNPIGRGVAKLTNPLFKRSQGALKSDTDKFIPFFILAICLLFGVINGAVSNNMILGVVVGVSSMFRFMAMFFIVSIIIGSLSIPGAGGVPVFFFRIGGIWVGAVRKVLKIRSNKIVIPSIILVLLIYIAIDAGIKALGRSLLTMPIDISLIIGILWQLVYSCASLLGALMIVLVVRALMSWVSPDPRNALVQLIYYMTEPLLSPIRRIVPPIAGFDLSVLVLMLLIGLAQSAVYKLLPAQVMLI
jgi:YggT family protein